MTKIAEGVSKIYLHLDVSFYSETDPFSLALAFVLGRDRLLHQIVQAEIP